MSVNPYSYKPVAVFNALDKNKDGNVTFEEVLSFKGRLAPKYKQAHQFLEDLAAYMGKDSRANINGKANTVEPIKFSLSSFQDLANRSSANGRLNRNDLKI